MSDRIFSLGEDQQIRAAFQEYIAQCNEVLKWIGAEDERNGLQSWLFESASSSEIAADLMHDMPIRSVTRFLGIYPGTEKYDNLTRAYTESHSG